MGKIKFLLLGIIFSAGMFVSSEKIYAQEYVPQPGDLIKTQTNPTVFLVDDQLIRRPLSYPAYVNRYGKDFSRVKIVSESVRGDYDYTNIIQPVSSHANGTLVIYTTSNPTIYVLINGFKHPFASLDAFYASGYSARPLVWIGSQEIYPTGPSFK